MKESRVLGITALMVCLMAIASLRVATGAEAERAGALTPVTLGAGSVLWLEGTSNIHDYECRSNEVKLSIAWAPDAPPPADAVAFEAAIRSNRIQRVELEVPIVTLRSGKDKLDRNLRKALRAEESPIIRFRLASYTLTRRPAGDDTLDVKAEGTLSVAGRDRPTTLLAHIYRDATGVWLDGSRDLRMTNFEVKPPTMMLGTLRVRDPVTVHYHLLLVPAVASNGSRPDGSN